MYNNFYGCPLSEINQNGYNGIRGFCVYKMPYNETQETFVLFLFH